MTMMSVEQNLPSLFGKPNLALRMCRNNPQAPVQNIVSTKEILEAFDLCRFTDDLHRRSECPELLGDVLESYVGCRPKFKVVIW